MQKYREQLHIFDKERQWLNGNKISSCKLVFNKIYFFKKLNNRENCATQTMKNKIKTLKDE